MDNALMEIGRKLVMSLSIDEREKHESLGIILSALEEAAKHGVQANDGGLCENCGEPIAEAALHEHCFPPAAIGG